MGRLKTIAETAKTVLQASNVGRSSQPFFMAVPFLSDSELGEELVPLGAPRMVAQHEASTASGGDQSEVEGSLLSNHSRQTSASKKRLSLSPRYEIKS